MGYQQQQYQKPLTLQIDLNQATYQAFLNCINSFQGLETESEMRSSGGSAISTMTSKVSLERFIYNIGVLDGIIGEKDAKWKGGRFESGNDNFDPFTYWTALVAYLKSIGFFKSPRRIAHL